MPLGLIILSFSTGDNTESMKKYEVNKYLSSVSNMKHYLDYFMYRQRELNVSVLLGVCLFAIHFILK